MKESMTTRLEEHIPQLARNSAGQAMLPGNAEERDAAPFNIPTAPAALPAPAGERDEQKFSAFFFFGF